MRRDARILTARGPGGMSPVTTPSVVRQIGSLFDGGSVAGLTDRQLIERFTGDAMPPARRPSPRS